MARVLIVDDEPDIVEMMELFLEDLGHEIIKSNSGEEALEYFKDNTADLVLLDVMMPGMDGWETLLNIKQNPRIRDTPVIMVTVRDNISDIERGFNLGVDQYIIKPFKKDVLRRYVNEVLTLQERKPSPEKEVSIDDSVYLELFSKNPTSVIILDDNYDVLDINPAAEALTGWKKGDLVSKVKISHALVLYDKKTKDQLVFPEYAKELDGKKALSFEFILLSKSGIEVQVKSEIFKAGDNYIMSLMNISK